MEAHLCGMSPGDVARWADFQTGVTKELYY